MSHRVEFKPDNIVEIFLENAEVPFLRQPNWPDQTPWASEAEACLWADMFIESIENVDAPFAPNGPGMERQSKPTAEYIALKSRFN